MERERDPGLHQESVLPTRNAPAKLAPLQLPHDTSSGSHSSHQVRAEGGSVAFENVEPRVPAESPPSYDSLFGELKKNKKSPLGILRVTKHGCSLACSSLTATVLALLLSAVPIAMIAIGSLYLTDCPAQQMVPIYLIVAGVLWLVKCSAHVSLSWQHKRRSTNASAEPEDRASHAKQSTFGGLLALATFIWFAVGSVYVYRTHPDFSDRVSESYCDCVVYYFAFWILTLQYICLAIGTLFTCGCCCCLCVQHVLYSCGEADPES